MKKIQVKNLMLLAVTALSTTPSNGMENAARVATTGLSATKKVSLTTIAIAATATTGYAAWKWSKKKRGCDNVLEGQPVEVQQDTLLADEAEGQEEPATPIRTRVLAKGRTALAKGRTALANGYATARNTWAWIKEQAQRRGDIIVEEEATAVEEIVDATTDLPGKPEITPAFAEEKVTASTTRQKEEGEKTDETSVIPTTPSLKDNNPDFYDCANIRKNLCDNLLAYQKDSSTTTVDFSIVCEQFYTFMQDDQFLSQRLQLLSQKQKNPLHITDEQTQQTITNLLEYLQ